MKVTDRKFDGKNAAYILDDGTVATYVAGKGWSYERNGRAIPKRYTNVVERIHEAINEYKCATALANVQPPQEPQTSWADIALAGLLGLVGGGILALTYVYRTGGF